MLKATDYVIDDMNPSRADGGMRGLIPRNYNANPVGSYEGSVTFDKLNDELTLIPWEDMPDMIAEKVAQKSQLSDIRDTAYGTPYPSLDQNGQGYCHTEDTEVLTETGWVSWPEYDGKVAVGTMNKATGNLEYQMPSARQVFEYKGEIIGSTNRRIDFAVTANHRMLVHKWDEEARTLSSDLTVATAGNIGWYAGLPHSTTGWVGADVKLLSIDGDPHEYSGDDFVSILGLVVSDGFAGGAEKNQNVVSFASFREDMRSVIEPLALRCGFREKQSARGIWIKTNHNFADWVRKHCYTGKTGAHNKKVPAIVGELSMRQIALFLHFFDDRNRTGTQFYSVSKRLIDDLQVLQMKLGKRSQIGLRPARTVKFEGNACGEIRGGKSYVLTVGDVDRLSIVKKKHISQDRYCGNVFCATVPNDTLVTRRNGSVLISCNCWNYSGNGALMVLRAKANMPYVRMSAHAGAWVIKGGRDQGGWGAQGLDRLRSHGTPSVEFWPEKSMDGRKYNTPETWENALLHRISEGFIDLDAAQYDRKLSFQQVLTCLLRNIPVIGDFNWWGHSVCVLDAVDVAPNKSNRDESRYGVRIINSWRDSWGANGTGVLTGRKAIPDGATAPRAVVVSDK